MTVWGGGNNVITSHGKHLDTYQRGKQRLPSLSYLLAGFVARSLSTAAQTSMTTVAG